MSDHKTTAEHYIWLYQQGSKVLEVVFTGRVAKKKMRSKEIVLHEIRPADDESGGFREWVKKDQLFTIEEDD